MTIDWTDEKMIAHVLNHLKDENKCFIDDLDKKSGDAQESHADKIAEKHLKVDEIVKEAIPHKKKFQKPGLLTVRKIQGASVACDRNSSIFRHRRLPQAEQA